MSVQLTPTLLSMPGKCNAEQCSVTLCPAMPMQYVRVCAAVLSCPCQSCQYSSPRWMGPTGGCLSLPYRAEYHPLHTHPSLIITLLHDVTPHLLYTSTPRIYEGRPLLSKYTGGMGVGVPWGKERR